MLPGYPNEGDLVRFNPPDSAYSPDCLQTQVRGRVGSIFQVCNDSCVLAWFGQDLLTINTAYLDLCEPPKPNLRKPSGARR
jgi:hypothetical protein